MMARCKFFAWDDEVEGDPTNIAVPSRSGQGSRNGQRAAPTGGGGGGGATGGMSFIADVCDLVG